MKPSGGSPIERSETLSDAYLVTAARSADGDERAFAELVRRYQRMVYAVALSLVRSADADDVAQDAFLRAFRNLDLLADPAKFGVWLRRITFGAAIDHVRAERSRHARTTSLTPDDDTDEATIDVPSPTPSALDRLAEQETVRRVLDALDRMPARYRVPLTLYHLDGLSHPKVAAALGVPESTVRSLVARARRKLARLLTHTAEVQDMTEVASTPRMMHVLNGDSVRMTLEHSSVPGTFVPYYDVLHEGPVTEADEPTTWRESTKDR
jgi:RNA polymerase sigma-70 factor, ECF subfamily